LGSDLIRANTKVRPYGRNGGVNRAITWFAHGHDGVADGTLNMKYFVIGDEDTVLGFAFTGIEGFAVESPEQSRRVFMEKVNDPEVGVIIMTEQVAETIGDEVTRIMHQSTQPVIVRIPGPEGPSPRRRSLQQLIQEAVGIKL